MNEQFLKTSRRRQRSNQELVIPTQTMPVTATLVIASVLAPLLVIIYIGDLNHSRERTPPLSISNNPLLLRQYPPQFDYRPLLIQSSPLQNIGVDNTTLLEQFQDWLRTNGGITTLMERVIDIVIELEMTLDQLKRTYVRDLRALGFVASPFLQVQDRISGFKLHIKASASLLNIAQSSSGDCDGRNKAMVKAQRSKIPMYIKSKAKERRRWPKEWNGRTNIIPRAKRQAVRSRRAVRYHVTALPSHHPPLKENKLDPER